MFSEYDENMYKSVECVFAASKWMTRTEQAKEIGISTTTLQRILEKKPIQKSTYKKIQKWAFTRYYDR